MHKANIIILLSILVILLVAGFCLYVVSGDQSNIILRGDDIVGDMHSIDFIQFRD